MTSTIGLTFLVVGIVLQNLKINEKISIQFKESTPVVGGVRIGVATASLVLGLFIVVFEALV